MILGFTNCSKDLVNNVCVVVVVVFNVVVVVVIVVVEAILKFFSIFEMNDLELVFLEPYPSFSSNNPKIYPKCNHKRRWKHTTCSTKSREILRKI